MSLFDLLTAYHPTDEEFEYKSRMIEFIQTHPDCFERSLEIGHITASAWLINFDGTKALLMHHTKLDMWVQPGGHCDGNSDVLAVAIKEAQEESGIEKISPVSKMIFDLDIHTTPETKDVKSHFHYDVRFLLQAQGNEKEKKNHESKALLWVDKSSKNLPTQSRSVLRMFDKWKEQ